MDQFAGPFTKPPRNIAFHPLLWEKEAERQPWEALITPGDKLLIHSCIISQAQKFINEYANFLKRQGKLPIPGSFGCSPPSFPVR